MYARMCVCGRVELGWIVLDGKGCSMDAFVAMVPARARHNFAAAPEPPQVSESFLFKFLHDGPVQPPQIPKTTYLLAVRFEFRFPQIPQKQRPNRG